MDKVIDVAKFIHDVAGVTGLLVLCILALLAIATWVLYRAAKKSAEEAKISRNEARVIQAQLQTHLETLLSECHEKCEAYELLISSKEKTIDTLKDKVAMLEKNESWLKFELSNLSSRLQEVEKR